MNDEITLQKVHKAGTTCSLEECLQLTVCIDYDL